MAQHVLVNIPLKCTMFPGNANAERNIFFQKHVVWTSKKICFVALESKIWKYDHILVYGRFSVDNGVACLDAYESFSVTYDIEPEYNENVNHVLQIVDDDDEDDEPAFLQMDRLVIFRNEIDAMMPPNCYTITMSSNIDLEKYEFFGNKYHIDKGQGRFNLLQVMPSRVFSYDFIGDFNKKTVITINHKMYDASTTIKSHLKGWIVRMKINANPLHAVGRMMILRDFHKFCQQQNGYL